MNIDDMRFFCGLFDASSVSAASRALYLSPQAVSKRLKKIESELGVDLFVRTPHGLTPTEAGVQTHDTFRSIASSYDELFTRLHRAQGAGPTVRLATEFYNTNLIDLGKISDFEARSPLGTTVQMDYLSNNDCYHSVSSGTVDIAVINRPLKATGDFTFHSLKRRTAFVCFSAHSPLATKEPLILQDFENLPFLGIREADSTNQAILDIFTSACVPIRLQTISYDSGSLFESIRSGRGFHVLPDQLALQYNDGCDIVARPFPSETPIFEIGLLVSNLTAHNPGVHELVDFVLANPDSILSIRA